MAQQARDVVGFKRIFVLFCTLVLLPAMLMSAFGVIAMLNERNAQKLAEREQADRLLLAAEAAVLGAIEEADKAAFKRFDARVDDEASSLTLLRSAGLPVGPAAVLGADALRFAEPPLSDPLADVLLQRARDVASGLKPGQPAHIESEPPLVGVVSTQLLTDGRILAYMLDDARLLERVAEQVPPDGNLSARLRLEGRQPQPEIGAVERLMAELGQATTDGDGVARRLGAPFERYTLVVEGPPSGAAGRITAVYLVLLLIFYATLITGVVIISRLIWQEARLSALKTDFVSHVSHELRTPLTSIRMFIETLELGRASADEQAECIELLAKETERLSEMIERVLGYARLKSGRRQFALESVDVDAVVEDAISAFRAHLVGDQDEKVQLEVDVPDDLGQIQADREALTEALLNLLGNAWKYTGPDKRIRVFARAGKRRITIGVEDNGPGLPKSEHQRVFERFYQARSLLSQPGQGSGLGLAITKGIVEGLGGRIHVESEPGKGATFIIELRPADEAIRHAA